MIPLKDSESAKIFPFWTILFVVINIVVFYLEITAPDPEVFISQFALIPENINFSNYSTLLPFLTSQFLHAGFLHIFSNMWFLWIFGDNVEGKFGFLLYPFIYLLSGATGNYAQYILDPTSTIPMLGASGAIAGVLGAYFAFFPHHKIKTLVLIPFIGLFTLMDIPAFFMLLYWIITQLFSGAIGFTETVDSGGVAYMAHIVGFGTGFILAKLLPSQKLTEYTTLDD